MSLINYSNSLENYNFIANLSLMAVVYLIISLLITNSLMIVYITWASIRYGNYFRISFSNLRFYDNRLNEYGIDLKKFKKLKNAIISDARSAIISPLMFIFFLIFYFIPFSYYQNQSYANSGTVKLFSTIYSNSYLYGLL